MTATPAAGPIRIGISSCLLGEPVRYDGGHKHDRYLTGVLGRVVEWVPVCPEVECGMGTPREPIRLVRSKRDVRLITTDTDVDWTDRMRDYARKRVERLASENLSGYVLKRKSPSCGLASVRIYEGDKLSTTKGRGLYAAVLLERFPHLPVEEERRLTDARIRENFVERVFGYWRLRGLFRSRWRLSQMVAFHTAHKLCLMAHSPEAYRRLGRMVARAKIDHRDNLERRYTKEFMEALSIIATPRRHTNVLQHMAGYFKNVLDDESRHELHASIESYRRGHVPLIVPITLFRHHIRVCKVSYLEGQVYLEPHPKELMLRSHV